MLVSSATLRKPHNVDIFIKARGKPLKALRSEIAAHFPDGQAKGAPGQRKLRSSAYLPTPTLPTSL